ncbi:hypothetical protein DL89DRAFT_268989 [Linderina pennispora]|uniref:F-box domain-containing protein n=1 Tax=Linderina pennispora TaxID=61395 RepID=A0A1Y1W3Q2_9FUNG|nr:uncharacterized protein DL89DRAFT_268989 [Linderina pennispora]ORX67784.1 hypothetical protein DL89DRAFT_268989 [Linderina pennispora]
MDNLPPHVIDIIISYTIGQDKLRPELRTDTSPLTVPRTLYPLMSVNREWRRVASNFINKSAGILIRDPDGIYQYRLYRRGQETPEQAQPLEDIVATGFERHVRHLQLNLPIESIADGTAYSAIDSLLSSCKGKLNSVQTVSLRIATNCFPTFNQFLMMRDTVASPQEQANIEREVSQNVGRIGKLLKKVVPNIVSVVYSGVHHLRFNNRPLNNALLSALLGGAPSVQYLSILVGDFSHTALESGLAPNVKHMHIDLDSSSSDSIPELAARYANCLETLSVESSDKYMLCRLFKNSVDESPVVYPNLRTFVASCGYRWSGNEETYNFRVNPFPELQRLICKGVFPFTTSRVLHWIRPTIEVMEINFRDHFYNRFVEDGVFSAGSFPNLRHVKLSWFEDSKHISIVDPSPELPRVLSLSPIIKKVVFDTPVASLKIPRVALHTYRTLKDLDLSGIQLTILQSILLISTSPELHTVTLSLKSSHSANERGSISDAKIKEFQEKNICTGNPKLMTLRIRTTKFPTRLCAAQHTLLLASVFKSLQRIEVCSLDKIRNAATLAAFDKAKELNIFDNDREDRIRCMVVVLVRK